MFSNFFSLFCSSHLDSIISILILDDVTEDEENEADEKKRLISQVLELQNTLDGEFECHAYTKSFC